MRYMMQLLSVTILLTGLCSTALAGPKLLGFKMVQQDNLMLHFDLDSVDAEARVFPLKEPHRLVIDLFNATLGTRMPSERYGEGVVEGVRYAQHDDFLRVVVDLRQAIEASWRLVAREDGQRLVINMGVATAEPARTSGQELTASESTRDVVIAIDAGHGGKDPGAIGRNKTFEKNVVLAVAIRLHNQLVGVRGIRPVLIRDSDVYIDLRERMERARQFNADMFVSIHADAINHETAHGSSVYALSMDGASSEAAKWLAKRENEAAALHGNISLEDLDDGLAKTLINLTQGNTMERSIEAGSYVLNELAKIGPVHKKTVEQAAFAVLKSPDIPSILIETAFISNREDEKKLNNPRYQESLANAIASGLYNYLQQRAPVGTYMASKRLNNGS